MPDSAGAGAPLRGSTSWKRAAVLIVPGIAAVIAITIGLAKGAIAAQFGAADSNMQLGVARLSTENVNAYVGNDRTVREGKEGLLQLAVTDAKASKLCLSTVVRVPIAGQVSLNVSGGMRTPANVDSLSANAKSLLAAKGKLGAVELGRDGSTLDRNTLVKGPKGSWGLQAAALDGDNVEITATNAGATSLVASGLSINVLPGKRECF